MDNPNRAHLEHDISSLAAPDPQNPADAQNAIQFQEATASKQKVRCSLKDLPATADTGTIVRSPVPDMFREPKIGLLRPILADSVRILSYSVCQQDQDRR